jgi:hypothetical protein
VPGLTQRGDACGTLESPEAESVFCSWQNPWNALDCLAARNLADIAIREAGVRFGTSGGREGGPAPYPAGGDRAQYSPPDGSMGNAFQHMAWNGLMVEKLGYEAAKGFADRHEMTSLSGDPQIRTWDLHHRGMDLANNWYSRELAERVLATNPGKNFQRRFFDEAEEFVRDDRACWIVNYDADRAVELPRFNRGGSRCGLR